MKSKMLLAGLCAVATGCATAPDKLQTTYVSPLQYKDYSCDQISLEQQGVTRRAGELRTSLDKSASNDNAQMAVGMILFWPALLFLEGGDGPEAAEYSRLKGERDALEKASIQKNCMQSPAQSTQAPAPTTAAAK